MEFLQQLIQLGTAAVDLFLHLDVHLGQLVAALGPWLYLVVFLVIFAETGLVVAPFLPGDSLLFALGALAALDGSPLSLGLLLVLLFVAAVLGDLTNYLIGSRVGPRIFTSGNTRFLNKDHLERTRTFYDRHGGKTIILARFIPIIRTFAPFVAGIGRMPYRRFALFNVTGAALWVPPFLLGGYFLGNVPTVKRNFHLVILAIIVISLLPAVGSFLKERLRTARA